MATPDETTGKDTEFSLVGRFRNKKTKGRKLYIGYLHTTRKVECGSPMQVPESDMETRQAYFRNLRSKCRCSCVLHFTQHHTVTQSI